MLLQNIELLIFAIACAFVAVVFAIWQFVKSRRMPADPISVVDNKVLSESGGVDKKEIAKLSYQLEALEFKNRTIQSHYARLREISIEEDINTELSDKLQIAIDAVKKGAKTIEVSASVGISECEAELIEAVHGKHGRFSDQTLH